jgi:hypothetical protein
MPEETQGIENARDARDLVLSAALALAQRTIEHIEQHGDRGVAHVRLTDELDAGGHVWEVEATYGRGHTFLHIEGAPRRHSAAHGVEVVASVEEMAAVMGGQQAAFACNVPRSWVEMACRGALELPIAEEQ